MTKNLLIALTVIGIACIAYSTPSVTLTDVTQNSRTRTVSVSYTLADTAVVTFSASTNGVPLPPSSFRRVWGAANRLLNKGSHILYWAPERDWPVGAITNSSFQAHVTAWATDDPPDWRVTVINTNIVASANHRYFAHAAQVPGGITNDRYKCTHLLMRRVHATGVTWRMGSGLRDVGRHAQETPHYVTLTNDYYLGIYEVTQRLKYHLSALGTLGMDGPIPRAYPDAMFRPATGTRHSVMRGNTNGAQEGYEVGSDSHLKKMRAITGIKLLDFPTEAEWEFACRAGCQEELYNGKTIADSTGDTDYVHPNLEEIAWYGANSSTEKDNAVQTANGFALTALPQKVGMKKPNDWGFYDMLGNVWEMTLDNYNANQYAEGAYYISPQGSETAGDFTRRGGSFVDPGINCRSAFRYNYSRNAGWERLGYRLRSPATAD